MSPEPLDALEYDIYTVQSWGEDPPCRKMPEEIHLVIAQTPTFSHDSLHRLNHDEDRPRALQHAEEIFRKSSGDAGHVQPTYMSLNRSLPLPTLIVFPELAFSCAQLCAESNSPDGSDRGGLTGLIARQVYRHPGLDPESTPDLLVFTGAGHNSGSVVALTIVTIALQIAIEADDWDSLGLTKGENPTKAQCRKACQDIINALVDLFRRKGQGKVAEISENNSKVEFCARTVEKYFRLSDSFDQDSEQRWQSALQIVRVALGSHHRGPGDRVMNDPFALRDHSDLRWYGNSIICEMNYNFGIAFFTQRYRKRRDLHFTIFFKRRPMQNFEKVVVPLFGATYRHSLFKMGEFTFAPMICFDFIDDSRDSSVETLKRYMRSDHSLTRSRTIAVVMCLNGEPSQEVWWQRITDTVESIGARQLTLVFAQVGYDERTIDAFFEKRWNDGRADVFRNLSGVYRHALNAMFRDAGRNHVVTTTPVLHAKTRLWLSVWAAVVRYLEPCIVSGTLAFQLSGTGNRTIWDAQRAVVLDSGDGRWSPDGDFEEIALQIAGWLCSRRMPVSRTARNTLRRLSNDLRRSHRAKSREELGEALRRDLLWGGARNPRPNPWRGAFQQQKELKRDELYDVRDDWAPAALVLLYVRDQLPAMVMRPKPGTPRGALLFRHDGGAPSLDEPIVVWRPPPSVKTIDDREMEAALTSFLAGFRPETHRVTILVVGEFPLGFTGKEASRSAGGTPLRIIGNGAAIEYEHWVMRRAYPGPPATVIRGWSPNMHLGLDPAYGLLRVRIVGSGSIVGLIRFEDDNARSRAALRAIMID